MTLERMISPHAIVRDDVKLGRGARVWHYANLYGCEIGENCNIGSFVEIQEGVKVGHNVTISTHSFICSLVEIDDGAWIGHHVVTINDLYPPSKKRAGTDKYWKPTYIGKKTIIGSNATLFPVSIGENAVVGAGSVVRRDIPAGQVWAGNPAKYICDTKDLKHEDGKYVFSELRE